MSADKRKDDSAVGLYLGLLKKTLTNTIYIAEPGEESEAIFVRGFIDHYIQGTAISMLPMARLDNLQFCIDNVLKHGVPGDLIETGVWRGGATIFMRAMLKARAVTDRTVWVADSFEGLPEPDAEKYPIEAETHHGSLMTKVYAHFAVDLEAVKSNFRAYGMLDNQVRFLKGWFKDTLPTAPISTLAIMRLDGDYFESTTDALTNLYDKLSVGGYAIIDDYAEDAWTHCRRAVDDFRQARNIREPLIQVDFKVLLLETRSLSMVTPANPTATRAEADTRLLSRAESVPQRKATVGQLVFTILASLVVALIVCVMVCLLPENDYQRWQLQDPDGRLRWIYERIHFDPTPIDVAIVGPSRAQLGLSAAAIEQDLAKQGKPANVANFAIVGAGRDLQWAILNELFKAKSPKVVVLEVDEQPYPFGHFLFRYVAPAAAIAFPPTPFLHNYLYNLAYLPVRKVKLFGANLFPELFGLTKEFDPEHYAKNRTDYSTSFIGDGKLVDMEHPIPRETLLAQPREPVPRTRVARLFTRINGGEDHLFIEKIAREAKATGAHLLFVYLPMFEGPQTVSDADFLKQFGPVLNYGDLAPHDELFENWSHLNHAGAMNASARLADAIGDLER